MNILHICCGYNLDYQGGITNYVRNIALTQFRNGHNVYVLTDGGRENGYKIIKNISNIESFSFHKKSNKNFRFLSRLFRYNKYDVIHIHMVLNLDSRLWKLVKPFKVVVSLHDYFYICPRISMINLKGTSCGFGNTSNCLKCFSILEKSNFLFRLFSHFQLNHMLDGFPLKSKKLYLKRFNCNKLLLENANLLLPVSNRVKEIYFDSGINGKYKVLHIGNFSSLNFSVINNKKCSNCINMVILSTVSSIKGGDLLVKIFSQVNNNLIKIHFFGRASNEHDKGVLNQIHAINHGPYTQSNLTELLKEMNMGIVCPIREDNAPQVVMELINNRIPVFGTRMGGIPDFVSVENGFLFYPYDENEISKAVDFLNNLTCEKVNQLSSHLTRTTTPDEHCQELLELYRTN